MFGPLSACVSSPLLHRRSEFLHARYEFTINCIIDAVVVPKNELSSNTTVISVFTTPTHWIAKTGRDLLFEISAILMTFKD